MEKFISSKKNHSTRLFPKNLGANKYKLAGIAKHCDYVVLTDNTAPRWCLIKNIITPSPRHIFLSMRSRLAIKYFVNKIFPRLVKPFVLISGSEDITLPNQLDKRWPEFSDEEKELINKLLASPLLVHWFCENLDELHPKMSPLPLGMVYPEGDSENEAQAFDFPPLKNRTLKALCSHRVREGKQWQVRRDVTHLAKSSWKNVCTIVNDEVSEEEFIDLIHQHVFVLCVQGGGIDPSPKAWLTLLHGGIPIVLDSTLREAYAEFPVVFVSSWQNETLSENKLKEWFEAFRYLDDDPQVRYDITRKLSLDYWWKKVENVSPRYAVIQSKNPILEKVGLEKGSLHKEISPKVLICTGFHRSATSATSNYLLNAGLHLGNNLVGPNIHNPKGHFEDWDVIHLHESQLKAANASWQFCEERILPFEITAFKNYIAQRDKTHKIWGVKDPRICLFLNAWKSALHDRGYFLLIIRHWTGCIESLMHRHSLRLANDLPEVDNKHIQFWLKSNLAARMWLVYNERLLRFVEQNPGRAILVSQDSLFEGVNIIELINNRFGFGLAVDAESPFDSKLLSETVSESILTQLSSSYRKRLDLLWEKLLIKADFKNKSKKPFRMKSFYEVDDEFKITLNQSSISSTSPYKATDYTDKKIEEKRFSWLAHTLCNIADRNLEEDLIMRVYNHWLQH